MQIGNILKSWNIDSEKLRSDIQVPGSSERCVHRSVVEDQHGTVWVLERLFPGQRERRERIGRVLAGFSAAGLPVLEYRPGPAGEYVLAQDGFHWQLARYVPGVPLPQPDFVDDEWRGIALGDFLVRLVREGKHVHAFDSDPDFDLPGYVRELMEAIAPRDVELHAALTRVCSVLEPFFDVWNDLPRGFCHGDFHPLNVIWGQQGVAAVIDWEFTGVRPVLYDVANCLGCVGIEDPAALGKGLAPAMFATLRDGGVLDSVSLGWFVHLLLGLRFAWMSEWLRRKDREMQELELSYMDVLVRNLEGLSSMWCKFS